MRRILVTAALLSACVSGLNAQIVWDSPFLVPPRPSPGLGIYLADVAGPGGTGALVTWQPTPTSWGFRFGIAESRGPDPDDDLAIFGGADVSGAIARASVNMPLDIDWVLGVGLGVADDVVVSVPIGLTFGHSFQGEGATFTPYATPRVIMDAWFGDRNETLDLELAVDLGLDLRLQPGWTIRFGGTIGDREAIAIGVVF